MRPVVLQTTGVGQSTPVVLDQYIPPENSGWSAVLSGTATYNVEYSEDYPYGKIDPVTKVISPYPNSYNQDATWFPLTAATGLTASASSNVAYPAKALRVNITAGTGTIVFTVVQAGITT